MNAPDVWTFASLIDASMRVDAHCEACLLHKAVDLAALRDRLGADHPAMAGDLKTLLCCPKCRSKRVSFTYSYRSGRQELIHGAWQGRGERTS